MKFTKKQINKERKTKKVKLHLIDELYSTDGPLIGLEKRIKEEVKNHWKWKSQKWADGEKFKLSEVIVEEDYMGWDGGKQLKVYLEKEMQETDEEAIKRLTANANAKKRRDNKKAIQEKKERTMLKKLKEKYGEEV